MAQSKFRGMEYQTLLTHVARVWRWLLWPRVIKSMHSCGITVKVVMVRQGRSYTIVAMRKLHHT